MFVSLITSIIALSIAALVIFTAGSWLARVADELADRTGLGEALFGIFLLMGMVKRETYGIGRIGFESALILVVYAVALGIVAIGG